MNTSIIMRILFILTLIIKVFLFLVLINSVEIIKILILVNSPIIKTWKFALNELLLNEID